MEWKARLVEFDYRCAYCLEKFEEDVLWLEHIIGINDGGEHRISNVIPSCQLCNQTKGNKSLWEFKQITVEQLFERVRDKIASEKVKEDESI